MYPVPSRDPFYAPATPVGRPGDLIRLRSVDLPLAVAVRAWQVVYQSCSVGGREVAMSGTVVIPAAVPDTDRRRPVLSYGVGVHGLGRDGAPSYLLLRGEEPEQPIIEMALEAGFVVLIPDGEGLGMPGPHTYGAGAPGGQGMLDLVRAAANLTSQVSLQAPLALWGYSEGGRCVAFAAELQPTYAPELALRAVAAGGVPADLHAVARAIDGGPFSGLALAVLIGLATAYDDPCLWDILSPVGRVAARHAAGLDVVGLVVDHPEPLAALAVREEPWDEPVWRRLLKAEDAGSRAPGVPAYLYHASADEIVPLEVGLRLARGWLGLGADVTWTEVPAPDHLTGGNVGAAGALGWLEERVRVGYLDSHV